MNRPSTGLQVTALAYVGASPSPPYRSMGQAPALSHDGKGDKRAFDRLRPNVLPRSHTAVTDTPATAPLGPVSSTGLALGLSKGARGVMLLSSNCGNPLSVSLPRRGRDCGCLYFCASGASPSPANGRGGYARSYKVEAVSPLNRTVAACSASIIAPGRSSTATSRLGSRKRNETSFTLRPVALLNARA